MDKWLAEVTYDPRRDFDLCIQLSEDDLHWALIERDDSGGIVLTVDPSTRQFRVPVGWLIEILSAAEKELLACGGDEHSGGPKGEEGVENR